MSFLEQQIPLGATVPPSPHAVCTSLPTMADVIAYEEKEPGTMAAVKQGYPRFLQHSFIEDAIRVAVGRHDLGGRAVYAVVSARAAYAMAEFVGAEHHAILPEGDFILVHFPVEPELHQRARAFLQHTGVSISSRQAEDYLAVHDTGWQAQAEALFKGDAQAHVAVALQQYLDTGSLWLTNCGMNACYAAISAVRKIQAQRGRHRFLQLGWLYLDTQRILEKLNGEPDALIVQTDVFDREALEQIFRVHGAELAAVVTELPTNPLVQTPDFEHLSALCRKYGVLRIVDPSVAGIANVDILPQGDVLVTSLTKYAAWRGDVMIGAVAVNEEAPFAGELAGELAQHVEPPYPRDLARLAEQIDNMPEVVAVQNENARAVADYLQSHPAVSRVFHPLAGQSAPYFEKIARSPSSRGAILTFELKKPLAAFYDRSRVVKGPSFGTHFTMMCPFLYLAHYDFVGTEEGRQHLRECGLNPDLVRLSVGVEPIAEIQAALAAGLD